MTCLTQDAQTVQAGARAISVSNDPYPHVEACQSTTPFKQCHQYCPTPALTSFQIWHELVAATHLTHIESISVLSLSTAFQHLCVSASASALSTGAIPASLQEDFAALAPKWPSVPLVKGWLARLDVIALKGAERPLRCIEDLILVLTTSLPAVNAIRSHARSHWREPLNVYLVPWNNDLKSDRELRIFCPPTEDLTSSKITTISQYSPDVGFDQTLFLQHANIILHRSWEIFERIQTRVPSELLRRGFSFDVIYNDQTRDMALIEMNEWIVE